MDWIKREDFELLRCEISGLRGPTAGILAIIAKRRICTPAELRQEMERRFAWSTANAVLYMVVRNLCENGFVNKQGQRDELQYAITQEGLVELQRLRTFYQAVIDIGPMDVSHVEAPAGMYPAPIKVFQRAPTHAELTELIAAANAQLADLLRGYQLTNVVPLELAAASVSDLDITQNVLRLPSCNLNGSPIEQQHISISDATSMFLGEQCGGRTNGPIFESTRGGYWNPGTLRAAFARARKRMGLSDEIVLHPPRKKPANRNKRKLANIETYLRAVGAAKPRIIAADLNLPIADVERILCYERFEKDRRGRYSLSPLANRQV